MKLLAVALFVLVSGISSGVWTAWAALDREVAFAQLNDGPWIATPTAYLADTNPYARARRAQRPTFGFNGGETLTFVASSDSEGAVLSAACRYVIDGVRLPARRWTLTALPNVELPEMDPPMRTAFTSSEVVRTEKSNYAISLSPDVASGNWIPTPVDYRLVLNLYDTTLLSGITQERTALPVIRRERCAT